MTRAGTELLLYRIGWIAEFLADSPYARHGAGFYDWAAKHGYTRQIYRLQHQALVEKQKSRSMGTLLKLTDKGVAKLSVTLDPTAQWNRTWDGHWDLVIFDIPESERDIRRRLRDILKAEQFGQLQKSVWLRPSISLSKRLQSFQKTTRPGVYQMMRVQLSVADQRGIVEKAWPWEQIMEVQDAYQRHLKDLGPLARKGAPDDAFHRWFLQEHALWSQWMKADPLLPRTLWPKSYSGIKLWKQKQRALRSYFRCCDNPSD